MYPSTHFQYIIFRRGIGIDRRTDYFFKTKLNTIIARWWRCFLKYTGYVFTFLGAKWVYEILSSFYLLPKSVQKGILCLIMNLCATGLVASGILLATLIVPFSCRIKRVFFRKSSAQSKINPRGRVQINSEAEPDSLCVERIRIENMKLRFYLALWH